MGLYGFVWVCMGLYEYTNIYLMALFSVDEVW